MDIQPAEKLAVLGLNGSGKSTLLQALTGYLTLNEGAISYSNTEQKTDTDQYFKYISLASPYLELVEDFTLKEHIEHVACFKSFLIPAADVLLVSGLAAHKDKAIKLFSSGMKQRLKLTLAILADAPLLFLDEPTTNLDAVVTDWYKELIANYAMHKTIVVCSNSIKEEYGFCSRVIRMEDYKLKPAL